MVIVNRAVLPWICHDPGNSETGTCNGSCSASCVMESKSGIMDGLSQDPSRMIIKMCDFSVSKVGILILKYGRFCGKTGKKNEVFCGTSVLSRVMRKFFHRHL